MNTNEYKQLFVSESLEYLEGLNQALLRLEKKPDDQSAIAEMFRTAHTIKGMAATMGLDAITDLTHAMENILDTLRQGVSCVTSQTVDVLLQCLDALGALVDAVMSGTEPTLDLPGLLRKLDALYGPTEKQKPKPALSTSAPEAQASKRVPAAPEVQPAGKEDFGYLSETLKSALKDDYLIYGLAVGITQESAFPGVRAYMVYKTVSQHGDVLFSLPDAQALQEGHFNQTFVMVFISKRGEEFLLQPLRQIAEVATVDLQRLPPERVEAYIHSRIETERESLARMEAGPKLREEAAGSTGSQNRSVQSIRVNIERLDYLQNVVGELVINKIRLLQIARKHDILELKEAMAHFDRISEELQQVLTQVRMVPMEHIFNRFPRMVRDLAKESGKEIQLEMLGKDIELDRTVLDEIHEPLVHLLRNAVDHGIETPVERKASSKPAQGIIRLSARREKNQVIIEVADDGKGMDPNRIIEKALAQGLISSEQARNFGSEEALNIIALPGFTTKVEATALSGRGVGVDVVRSKIESFGGTMRIQSEPGAGSAFILKIPITLAIIQALLFRLGQEIYSIPVLNTVETLEYDPSQLQKMKQGEMITYRESYMLLIRLGAVLEVPNSGGEAPSQTVLVVENNDRHFGLLVDEVIGQQEIAIKSLGPFLKQVRGFSGVTILGDGRICMVLDVPSLLG